LIGITVINLSQRSVAHLYMRMKGEGL